MILGAYGIQNTSLMSSHHAPTLQAYEPTFRAVAVSSFSGVTYAFPRFVGLGLKVGKLARRYESCS